MKARIIDIQAPMLTGDPQQDTELLVQYVESVVGELNFILTLIHRRLNEEE